jgi:hypothetical protein
LGFAAMFGGILALAILTPRIGLCRSQSRLDPVSCLRDAQARLPYALALAAAALLAIGWRRLPARRTLSKNIKNQSVIELNGNFSGHPNWVDPDQPFRRRIW